MKNIYIILVCLFFVVNLFALDENATFDDFGGFEDSNFVAPKLHREFGLDGNMSVQIVANKMEIPLNMFKTYFRLNLRDPRIDDTSLNSLNITIDQVYQLYNLENFGFNDYFTLFEVSQILNVPFKRMAEYLEIDQQDTENRSKTIRNLGVETQDIFQYRDRFNKDMLYYSSSLTVMAISVILIVLSLLAYVISKIVLLDGQKLPKVKIPTPIGTVSTDNIEFPNHEDTIVAIVAAIHKFKSEVAIDHKILLTYRRIDVSMWQASGKMESPNRQYQLIKR